MQSKHNIEWMTAEETAKRLQVGVKFVRELVRSGFLDGKERLVIDRRSVEEFVRARRAGSKAGLQLEEIRGRVREPVPTKLDTMRKVSAQPENNDDEGIPIPESVRPVAGHAPAHSQGGPCCT